LGRVPVIWAGITLGSGDPARLVAISVPDKGGESQPHEKTCFTSGNQRPSYQIDVSNLLK
jgi:hypothetical protein